MIALRLLSLEIHEHASQIVPELFRVALADAMKLTDNGVIPHGYVPKKSRGVQMVGKSKPFCLLSAAIFL